MSLQELTTDTLNLSGVVGVICFLRMTSTPLRVLVIYILLAIVIDEILINGNFENRGMWVKILYTPKRAIEYVVFIGIFYKESTFVYKKQFCALTILILLGFGFYSLIFNLKSKTIAADMLILEGIFVILLVLHYFKSLLLSSKVVYLSKEPIFWISTGLLFFFAGNIIATGFYHQLKEHIENLAKNLYRYSNYLLNILLYLTWIAAFLIDTQQRDSNGK